MLRLGHAFAVDQPSQALPVNRVEVPAACECDEKLAMFQLFWCICLVMVLVETYTLVAQMSGVNELELAN